MEPQKLGTDALEQVVELVLDGFDVGKAIAADGKVDGADLAPVLAKLPEIGAGIVGVIGSASAIIPELKDLDSDEIATLGAVVIARGIAGDSEKAKLIVGGCLKIAAGGVDIARGIALAPASA